MTWLTTQTLERASNSALTRKPPNSGSISSSETSPSWVFGVRPTATTTWSVLTYKKMKSKYFKKYNLKNESKWLTVQLNIRQILSSKKLTESSPYFHLVLHHPNISVITLMTLELSTFVIELLGGKEKIIITCLPSFKLSTNLSSSREAPLTTALGMTLTPSTFTFSVVHWLR